MIHLHCYHPTGNEKRVKVTSFLGCKEQIQKYIELKCCGCDKFKWKKYVFWC